MSLPSQGITMSLILQACVDNLEQAQISSLIPQGLNSPDALRQNILNIAKGLMMGTVAFPDATADTAQKYAGQIYQMALLIPKTQWDQATYNPAPGNFGTIAQAVAFYSSPPPPAPPTSNALVGSCFLSSAGLTICYQGLGVTGATATGFTYDGTIYPAGAEVTDQSTGKKYRGVTAQELMGYTVLFYPVVAS
jgi:hypothetical protein